MSVKAYPNAFLPVVFVGHGSPMLALEAGPWHLALRTWASGLQGVRAILVVSAHWETPGAFSLTSAALPGLLYDFHGFPEALYRLEYPSPGEPDLASRVADRLRLAGLPSRLDPNRPLDHGAWVPLRAMFPEARIPVIQLSLPSPRSPELLLKVGQVLAPLRAEGVLIVASGGLVHNLGRLAWDGHPTPDPWAKAFEEWMMLRLLNGDREGLLKASTQAPGYLQAVPTSEHLDPLYLALGAAEGDVLESLHVGWQHGNLSLRAVSWKAGLESGILSSSS